MRSCSDCATLFSHGRSLVCPPGNGAAANALELPGARGHAYPRRYLLPRGQHLVAAQSRWMVPASTSSAARSPRRNLAASSDPISLLTPAWLSPWNRREYRSRQPRSTVRVSELAWRAESMLRRHLRN